MNIRILNSFTKVKIIIFVVLITIVFLVIILNIGYKRDKNVNNKTSQEIVQYISNISEYNSKVEVTVTSNKTSNKYILEQNYKDGVEQQIVKEPKNIEGLSITKNGNELKIEDTNLNITKIISNYEYLSDNCLDLFSFVKEYNENQEKLYEEKDNYIIMKLNRVGENKYTKQKLLYIDKNTYIPMKMQIKDANNNTRIDIKYNEINIK